MDAANARSGRDRCPRCSSELPAGAEGCPSCGAIFDEGADGRGGADGVIVTPPRRSAAPFKQTLRVVLLLALLACLGVGIWWKFGRGGGPVLVTGHSAPSLAVIDSPAPSAGPLRAGPFLAHGAGGATKSRPIQIGMGETLRDMAFSPDGRFLLGASAARGDFALLLWDVAEGKRLQRIRLPGPPVSLAVASGGTVVMSDMLGLLHRCSLHASGWLGWSRLGSAEGLRHMEVALGPDGRLLATTAWSQPLGLLDLEGFKLLGKAKMPELMRRPAFSPDGRLLAAGNIGDRMTIWDLTSGRGLTYKVPGVGARSDIRRVVFSPDGRLLATAHIDAHLTVWDVQRRGQLACWQVPEAPVYDAAFGPGGELLASAHHDGKVRLWNPRTGKLKAALEGHAKAVRRLCFHPGGRHLATYGEDGRILLWSQVGPPSGGSAVPEVSAGDLLAWNLRNLPEAEPFAKALIALKQNDVEALKGVFSRETAAKLGAVGWDKIVRELKKHWGGTLGSTPVGRIHVEFAGDSRQGVLHAIRGLRPFPPTPVLKEGEVWKVHLPTPRRIGPVAPKKGGGG
jgi:hypothetical protein